MIRLLVLAFLCLAAPEYAQAQEVIQEIQIQGTQRIDNETVLSYLILEPGDPFDPKQLREALKILFQTGFFADIVFERQENTLIVIVEENPILNQILFEGNDQIESEALLAEITLEPRAIYSRNQVQTAVQRLLTLYLRNGRFNASVEPKIVSLEQGRIDLIFEIEEGEKSRIAQINFVGNRVFSDSYLKEQIITRESAWWRLFSVTDTYDPARLEVDGDFLRRFYLKRGYADFEILSTFSWLSPDLENFFITFVLEEGPRYRVNEIAFSSTLPGLDTDPLYSVLTFDSGDWYDAQEVEENIFEINEAIAELDRYPFYEVRPQTLRDPESQNVDITYVLQEGPRQFIERITITGNTRTLDEVIRQEFLVVEGDPVNTARINRSLQRVRNLGFFSRVDSELRMGSAPDKVILAIDVSEQPTGNISFGIGYSTTSGVLGSASISERNIFGYGIGLTFEVTISEISQSFVFGIRDPHFLKYNLEAGLDAFVTTTNRGNNLSFAEQRSGFSITFGYSLTEYLRQRFIYTFSQDTISDITDDASLFLRSQEGDVLRSQLQHSLIYDRRDNAFNPTEGYVLRMFNDFAGLGGDLSFLRTRVNGAMYISFFERPWILSLFTEAGHIVGLFGDDVRISERFFLGGNTLRGFDVAGVGPRDISTNDSLGGEELIRTTLDLSIPLGLPQELNFRAHTFLDGGTLGKVTPKPAGNIESEHALRLSIGAGISWSSPVGPIRLDYAVPLADRGYDLEERIRFSIGVNF